MKLMKLEIPTYLVTKCSYCQSLFALDEVCCHRCYKPSTWNNWKFFWYRVFGYKKKEFNELFQKCMSMRDLKNRMRQRNIDKTITMKQLSNSLKAISTMSEIRNRRLEC